MGLLNARRLRGLSVKETKQILRDPSSILIAVVLPLVLLLLFGFGVSLNAERVPVAVVLQDDSEAATSLLASFAATDYFVPTLYHHRKPAEAALVAGDVRAVVVVPENAEQAMRPGAPAEIQVIVDGTDANTARIVLGYAAGVYRHWLDIEGRQRGRELMAMPAQAEARVWFNPGIRSRNHLIPGIIAVIMTLIGALLTALLVLALLAIRTLLDGDVGVLAAALALLALPGTAAAQVSPEWDIPSFHLPGGEDGYGMYVTFPQDMEAVGAVGTWRTSGEYVLAKVGTSGIILLIDTERRHQRQRPV